jgi:hypothetical protein
LFVLVTSSWRRTDADRRNGISQSFGGYRGPSRSYSPTARRKEPTARRSRTRNTDLSRTVYHERLAQAWFDRFRSNHVQTSIHDQTATSNTDHHIAITVSNGGDDRPLIRCKSTTVHLRTLRFLVAFQPLQHSFVTVRLGCPYS